MKRNFTAKTDDGTLEICPCTVTVTNYKGKQPPVEMVHVSIDDGFREMTINITKSQAGILAGVLTELSK